MDEYLPYLDVYEDGLAPVVEDFGGGFTLPEGEPQRFTAEDRERELIALLSQMTPPPTSEPVQRQPRGKRIKTSSASLGTIDRDTGKFTSIYDQPDLYRPSINVMRTAAEQRALAEMFPSLAWGYKYGELVPFGAL